MAWREHGAGRKVKRGRTSREGIDAREREDGQVGWGAEHRARCMGVRLVLVIAISGNFEAT